MKKLLLLVVGLTLVASGAAFGVGETISHSSVSYTIDGGTPAWPSRPDSSGDELADGTTATSDVNHSNWVEWAPDAWNPDKPAYAYIKFDIGSLQNLYQVAVTYLNYNAYGIYHPERMDVRLSTDNTNWTGWSQRYGFTGTGTAVYTNSFSLMGNYRYIEVKVRCDDYSVARWMFLTEFTFKTSTSTGQEITAGKFYTYSDTPSGSYADEYPVSSYSAGVMMTNQESGNSSWTSKWVGWSNPAYLTIVVDLGQNYEVNAFYALTCGETRSGIYYPDWVQAYTSTNGTTWTQFGSTAYSPADPYYYTRWTAAMTGSYVTTRYAKFHMYNTRWCFIDEVQAYGKIPNEARELPATGAYIGAYPTNDSGYMDVGEHQDETYETLAMVLWYHEMNPYYGYADFSSDLGYLWASGTLGKTKYGGASYGGYRYLNIGWLPKYATAEQIAKGNAYPTTGTKFDQHFDNWFYESVTDNRNGTNNTDALFIRPMNEMNGSWTWPSGGTYLTYGGYTTWYKRAWRRMYNIAQQRGATDDHIFVWSPAGVGSTSSSHDPADYYPGDQYVDWVGISCYSNTSDYPSEQLTGGAGSGGVDLQGDYGYKPLIISEGSIEDNWSTTTNRTNWIDDWLDTGGSAMEVPELRGVIWYDQGNSSVYDWGDFGSTEKYEYRSEIDHSYWESTH